MTIRAEHSARQFLPTSLRALIIAAAFWVLSLSLTVTAGSLAAVLGCFFACYVVDLKIHQTPFRHLRNSSILGACCAMAILGFALGKAMSASTALAAFFSPIMAFNISEAAVWFLSCAAIVMSLRTLAHRTSYGAVVEILVVASAFIVTLAAHRNGMIHRPFFIGDFALIRGIDPASILMALGCAAVLALAALLMMEKNQKRLPWHFAVLGLLCFSLIGYVRMFGLPTPAITDDLGLTGQEQSGNNRQRENPFRDSANTADDKEAPVAVVVFRDDYEPLNGAYYFRESAYSQFNGVMLDYTTREDMDRDLIKQFTNTETEAEVLPGAQDQRRLVRTTIGMLVAHRNPFGLVSPVSYESTANPDNLRFKRAYNTYSMAPEYEFDYLLGRELGRDEWSEEVLQEYLALPADSRYGELANSLIGNLRPEYANDPYAKAWAIKSYLDEHGIYSLKNAHAYETDPAASFLFGDLTGYCMHFSFAATYLYRSLGIPARVGIGYSVPASNRAGGSALLIQAIHGHAWPEIYLKDIGWVIVDPAPQQTLVDMTTDPQNELQQLLGDMLRDDASFADFLDSQQGSGFALQTLLDIAYAVVLLGLCLGYGVKWYRLFSPALASDSQQYRIRYRAILDRLAAIGISRRYGETRESFANRLQQEFPTLQRATRAHLAAALGSDSIEPLPPQQWADLSKALQKEIKLSTHTWQRVLAALNPVSWWYSR